MVLLELSFLTKIEKSCCTSLKSMLQLYAYLVTRSGKNEVGRECERGGVKHLKLHEPGQVWVLSCWTFDGRLTPYLEKNSVTVL